METYAKFSELPISCLRPAGWVRQYLQTMRDGLTGHMEHGGKPFTTDGWLVLGEYGIACDDWGPYEQLAYWTDGAIRCGHLLDDSQLVAKARKPIEAVLAEPDRDGYLGPKCIRKALPNNRWPHAVFFRAMMAHYLATGDKRILKALTRHYLADHSTHTLARDVCNVEIMLWTYAQTGDRRLLKLAVKAFDGFNRWLLDLTRRTKGPSLVCLPDTMLRTMASDRRPGEHGVTFCEIGKLGSLLYAYTGNRKYLDACEHGFAKVERYSLLIDGVPSSVEHLSGKDALDAHETCVIADYTWSLGYLLMVTGKAQYADKIERACFNAAPGAVTADFKGLQYFSTPNQVVADRWSNHMYLARGLPYNRYGPNPATECCPGEVHRIMPNYAARMWMSDGRGGLVAALYGPSRVTAGVGKSRTPVTIEEKTDYPFEEQIDFVVRTRTPVRFSLNLRIPGWCRKARVLVNGAPADLPLRPGTFVELDRTFADGDRVRLELPMEVRVVKHGPTVSLERTPITKMVYQRRPGGGVSIERGPLLYTLQIKEDWQVDPVADGRSTPQFPAYNLYAASPWNYALALEGKDPAETIEVVRRRPKGKNRWTQDGSPLVLRVPARLVKGWTLDERTEVEGHIWSNTGAVGGITVTHKGRFRFTPPLPDKKSLASRLDRKVQMVTFIPYGCARMRMTILPVCG